MIYFIQATPSELIKIGFSRSIPARLRLLQTSTVEVLTVLGVLHGGFKLEASLHAKFSDSRVSGEWFRPTSDILMYVKECTKIYDNQTALADSLPFSSTLSIKQKNQLWELGERIRLARHRRNLTAEMMAERAGISRPTYRAIERGEPAVAIGKYLNVLNVLGLHEDFKYIASNDVLGQTLQDAKLGTRVRPKTIR